MAEPTLLEQEALSQLTPTVRTKALGEINSRPTATPIEGRHFFTAQELEDIRNGTDEARQKWPAMFNQFHGR